MFLIVSSLGCERNSVIKEEMLGEEDLGQPATNQKWTNQDVTEIPDTIRAGYPPVRCEETMQARV